jgi:DNA-nicking Smr family endonuclease
MKRLTKADKEIWERLRETVKPLRKRREAKAAAPIEPAEVAAEAPKVVEAKKVKSARPTPPALAKPKAPTPPALAPLEERTRKRLGRGLVEIDAKIDLHGMRQERAHDALVAFLWQAQAQGHRIVIVVTGKGKVGEARGVLRYAVPGWLSRPDLRELVVGFEEAGRRHGGEGALYVRIRRRRATRLPSSVAG